MLSFSPASQTVGLGASVTVDLVVSGLHDPSPQEIVSGFDFDVLYDAAILSATGVTFASNLGGPADSFQDFDLTAAGLIDLAEFSFLDDATLDALQSDSITLATLSFSAIGSGTSGLAFAQDGAFVLTGRADAQGIPQPLAPLEVQGGSVIVQQGQVPAAPTIALLALGLVVLIRTHLKAPRAAAH